MILRKQAILHVREHAHTPAHTNRTWQEPSILEDRSPEILHFSEPKGKIILTGFSSTSHWVKIYVVSFSPKLGEWIPGSLWLKRTMQHCS
eukprot:c2712_g1_i1 orf=778-1047(-)